MGGDLIDQETAARKNVCKTRCCHAGVVEHLAQAPRIDRHDRATGRRAGRGEQVDLYLLHVGRVGHRFVVSALVDFETRRRHPATRVSGPRS